MHTSLVRYFGLALIVLAIFAASTGNGSIRAHAGGFATPDIQTVAPLPLSEKLAFSTIFPAFVPNKLPVANIVDIVVEGALQQQSKAEPLRKVADESAARRPIKDTVETPLPLATSRKVSSVAQNLQDFRALLRPEGFLRPLWQDLSISAQLSAQDSDIEPFIVMIDPGHGGTDPGARGHNGLLEKDLTLDIARRVRLFLTEFDHIDVRLTRNHDHGLSRQSRVRAIHRSEADMVISLHFNHLPQTNVNLVESYYAGAQNIARSLAVQSQTREGQLQRTGAIEGVDLSFTKGSSRLAHVLQQRVFAEVSFDDDAVQNAGVKQETLFVLTRSFTPSVLLEISCLSHKREADRLAKDGYRNRLAAALVDGIRDYHDSLQRAPLKKRGDIGA